MRTEPPDSGWELVAQHDEAAALLQALTRLEPDTPYTRSDIADAAGVSLKALYLADSLDEFVELGLLERVGGGTDSEAQFLLNSDSDILDAAAQFDEAVADAYDGTR